MHPVIRKAQVDDAGILSVLATEVWLDTYAKDGISSAFAAHLLEEYSPTAFTTALSGENVHIYLCTGGDFVKGYVKLTMDQSALDPRYGTVEVATLYVRRHHKRQGIGTKLLRQAFSVAAEAAHRTMYLTIHHANHDAMAFYKAHRFHKVGDLLFEFEGIEVPNFVLAADVAPSGAQRGA